jgi:hypothetical protein
MKRNTFILLCAISMSLSCAPANAQRSDQTQYYDQRTPQGTLRAFTAALTKADLAKATTHIANAEPAANLSEIKQAMQKRPTSYSIMQLRIAVNGDLATVSFLFEVRRQRPDVSSWYGWAALRQTEGAWQIDPTRTLEMSNSVDPFSSFVSLLSGKRLPGEERDDITLQGSKFLRLGTIVQTLAADKGGKFALQGTQLRQSLLPYYPALDVLLRYPQGQSEQVSFNTRLTNVPLSKIRNPQRTVMLYEGQNGQLDFRHNGRAMVTFVAGHVRYVNSETAKKLLLRSP